jgi:DNA-binding SARP family transcriptional activator
LSRGARACEASPCTRPDGFTKTCNPSTSSTHQGAPDGTAARTGCRTRLDPTLVATDVEAFTTAIHQAAAATTDTAARAAALRTAVGTYAGPLCEGADYPWADALREALHRKAVDALVLLADHTAAHHPEPDPALALLDRATDWDPYNEPVYQRIIRLQLATGRDDAARRTYHHLTRRLTEIDATPDPATTALLRQAVSGFFRE